MRLIESPSPNFGERRDGAPVDMLVLHYTGMPTAQAALARMMDPAAEVSAHYMVDETGDIYRLVAEDKRAWHAGQSYWAGATDINSRSIGIEIVNPGHEFGYRDFPEGQIAALEELLLGILARHAIPPSRVLAHSDVAPERKEDPGERFPWERLAKAGIGVWFQRRVAPPPDAPVDLAHLIERLEAIGYRAVAANEAAAAKTIAAFQRHWLPHLIGGTAEGRATPAAIAAASEIASAMRRADVEWAKARGVSLPRRGGEAGA
ncbi:MAG: N-acetylmuramoyl-L-alanine amidase [Alphaproteobacteria bacterium]